MNCQHIAETEGHDLARIIDEESGDFEYETIDAEAVDDLARDARILGVETIDYPLTDGLIIYLKRPAGDVMALLIEPEPDEAGLYDVLQTKTATIREADIDSKEM